ncbi:hypothetical protein PG997_000777 [Apiospora hydei]|uniref:Uncharacterized protein n=1 Tax=Apiospora hydei TaxID=1337664 RepID=A0ABR1XBP4_9PEZI
MHRVSPDLTDPSRNIEESTGDPLPAALNSDMELSPLWKKRTRKDSIPHPHGLPLVFTVRPKTVARTLPPHPVGIPFRLRTPAHLTASAAVMVHRASRPTKDIEFRGASVGGCSSQESKLAEIVAACAEEVKRAKAVAESIKEKREKELSKLKLQMEERHAEAEKRREELRSKHASKRSRGHSMNTKKPDIDELPDVRDQDQDQDQEPSTMTDEVAASKIQWWWRGLLRRQAVQQFSELGLTIDGVLMTTAQVLRLCGLKEGEAGSVNEMAAVRTFLGAFLILGHPTQVLSNKDNKGDQEQVGSAQGLPIPRDDLANPQLQDLVGKARDLLISFETILSRLTYLNNYTPPPALEGALPEAYATFHNAFIAWKARDSNALIEVMLLQFVELDAILQTVKDGTEEHVTESYRQSVKDHQVMLMVRIKRLAANKPTGDTKPRATGHSLGRDGSTAEDHTAAEEEVLRSLNRLTPPSTPQSKPQGKEVKFEIPHMIYPPILPDNRVIVHELAMNREYRIEFQHFQEQHKLRMDPLFQDLKSGVRNEEKEFHYLVVMAHYIKDRLQHLVKDGSPMYTFIGEILDTEVAQRQFLAGSFSYEKFFSSMGALLPKLCAPVRDEEVKELAEKKLADGNVVDRLEALISFIDTMLYDYANYMMQVAAPSLLEHASSYETKRFAEELEKGTFTLARAGASWRSARGKVHAEAMRRDPEGVNHPKLRPTPDKIYWQMLLNEFTQPSPDPATIPEPLALDVKRRARLGRQTLQIVTAGAILLQCKNMLKRDVRAPWRTEAGRIFTVLEAVDDSNKPLEQTAAIDGIMAALEAGRSMPQATKGHIRALVTKLLFASAEAKRENSEPREPVLRLLLTRVKGHILSRLQAGSASEKVKATSAAGEKLAGLGLPEFVERVREMVEEIARTGAVDREAHGLWWETVADQADKEAASSG